MGRAPGEDPPVVRALILVLAAVVVALAVSIVHEVGKRPDALRQTGPRFDIVALLPDSVAGEWAVYREAGSGQMLRWGVTDRPAPLRDEAPHVMLRRDYLGRDGQPDASISPPVTYAHQLVHHGWFPFMAPERPGDLDRVWVVRTIKRATLRRGGRDVQAWRVELLDPALPPDMDTVVAWFDETVPVFGLLQWERHGETWVFTSGSGRRS